MSEDNDLTLYVEQALPTSSAEGFGGANLVTTDSSATGNFLEYYSFIIFI